jgi:hypothetical protein
MNVENSKSQALYFILGDGTPVTSFMTDDKAIEIAELLGGQLDREAQCQLKLALDEYAAGKNQERHRGVIHAFAIDLAPGYGYVGDLLM